MLVTVHQNTAQRSQGLTHTGFILHGVHGVGVVIAGEGKGVGAIGIGGELLLCRGRDAVVCREEISGFQTGLGSEAQCHSVAALAGADGGFRVSGADGELLLVCPGGVGCGIAGSQLNCGGLGLGRIAAFVRAGLSRGRHGEAGRGGSIVSGSHFPHDDRLFIGVSHTEDAFVLVRHLPERPLYGEALGSNQLCGHRFAYRAGILPIGMPRRGDITLERYIERLAGLICLHAGG